LQDRAFFRGNRRKRFLLLLFCYARMPRIKASLKLH
jgi:hypothetical protein